MTADERTKINMILHDRTLHTNLHLILALRETGKIIDILSSDTPDLPRARALATDLLDQLQHLETHYLAESNTLSQLHQLAK